MYQKAKKIIKHIENSNLYIECPECNEKFLAKKAGLFYLNDFTKEALEMYKELKLNIKQQELELKQKRKNIRTKSEKATETVNVGFILERLVPVLKSFKFEHNDCRSLGDPIDYIIFEGLTKKEMVTKLFFVEIKTGNAKLNKHQKQIKEIVAKKNVEFDVYEVKK